MANGSPRQRAERSFFFWWAFFPKRSVSLFSSFSSLSVCLSRHVTRVFFFFFLLYWHLSFLLLLSFQLNASVSISTSLLQCFLVVVVAIFFCFSFWCAPLLAFVLSHTQSRTHLFTLWRNMRIVHKGKREKQSTSSSSARNRAETGKKIEHQYDFCLSLFFGPTLHLSAVNIYVSVSIYPQVTSTL